MTTPIEKILSRLDSPKKGYQDGQYLAFCSHQTQRKERKLSLTERTDGSVRIKCWGGCEFHEILNSLGLKAHELYPPRNLSGREPKRNPPLVSPNQCLELIHEPINLMAITVLNFCNGVELSEQDMDRLLYSAHRALYLLEMSKGKQ